MRINVDSGAQQLPESSRSSGQSGSQSLAGPEAGGSAAGNVQGQDRAELSAEHAHALAQAQMSQLPEIREERVSPLRQVVAQGSYHPSPADVAGAILSHLAVERAA
jgi:flagellar biosynthesis anti-sigma factor FlgM